jgi:hypothetical protein
VARGEGTIHMKIAREEAGTEARGYRVSPEVRNTIPLTASNPKVGPAEATGPIQEDR